MLIYLLDIQETWKQDTAVAIIAIRVQPHSIDE